MKKKYSLLIFLTLWIFGQSIFAKEKIIRVVSTTTDLASIVSYIGGGNIQIKSLAKAENNLHYLSARPDYILSLNKADLLLLIGAELEKGWLPLVLKNSRNSKIQIGSSGYCDISKAISLLEKKTGTITREMGDLHPSGNPHYWLDPIMGIRIAKKITTCLSKIDVKNTAKYKKNFQSFQKEGIKLSKVLLNKMKNYFGTSVVPYHSEFIYLAKRFRLKIPFAIEEKPGVKPGPARIKYVIQELKKQKVKLIFGAPWNDWALLKNISRKSGIQLVNLPIHSVIDLDKNARGQEKDAYFKMLRECIQRIRKALSP